MMCPENTLSIQEKVQSIRDRPFETFEPICLLPVIPESDFSVVSQVLEYEKKIRRSESQIFFIERAEIGKSTPFWVITTHK
ncbi:hypothetical protein B738_10066 [Photorhabdus temperata subsp. temperata M1021]|nr:hypothetical protein B738_10066 [Photorhabdus temperata subsp. temperata M1021]